MKFYTTLSSSFRSNIWIIFPQKEKFLSRLATFFFPSFSLSPFFLFLSERERLSVFFERTNTTIERDVSRITIIGAEGRDHALAGRDKCGDDRT